MSLYEPLFLLLVVMASAALVVAIVRRVRGDRTGPVLVVQRLAVGAVIYFTVVAATSLLAPQRVYRVGDPQCFDDWCITVVGARWTGESNKPGGERYQVSLRLSSRARRMPMGERGTVVYLMDDRGQRYDPVPEEADVAFDTVLQPGQSLATTRRFDIPRAARGLGLVYTREGGFPIGWFVVGEVGWFRRPPVVRLD